MKIAFVGASKPIHEQYCTHWTGIDAAFKRMPHEYRRFCCRYDEIFAERIVEWKPDVLVYNLIDMALEQEEKSRWIREKLPNTKIVFWYTDCRTPQTGQIQTNISSYVDLFITSSEDPHKFHEKHFGMKPEWVGQAAEPTPSPVYSQKAATRFLFVGGKYDRPGFKQRLEIVNELEENHGLKVVSGHSPEERAKVYEAMPLLYGSAQFTLDISHFWDIPKYTSNRYWVIPAYWGFCMTKRFPKHEELVPETHHVYWDTADELVDKMSFYETHEDERRKMIVRGWEYAKDHHTYEHRINRILGLLGLTNEK